MVWAAVGGVLLPIIIDKMGKDPAISAGPFLTTTTDLLGFATFLGLAKLFLV
jgi:magnesium transporter